MVESWLTCFVQKKERARLTLVLLFLFFTTLYNLQDGGLAGGRTQKSIICFDCSLTVHSQEQIGWFGLSPLMDEDGCQAALIRTMTFRCPVRPEASSASALILALEFE